jgi:hypothetical protein
MKPERRFGRKVFRKSTPTEWVLFVLVLVSFLAAGLLCGGVLDRLDALSMEQHQDWMHDPVVLVLMLGTLASLTCFSIAFWNLVRTGLPPKGSTRPETRELE